jgi:hypothetical protein
MSINDTVTIAPSLPRYIFNHTFPTETEVNNTVNRFDISQVGHPIIQQTILDTGSYVHGYELMDINFDGYSDLKIQGSYEEYGELSSVYLFDPSSMLFVFCDELSGLSNLSVDSIEKEVTSSTQFPRGTETEECSYKFQGGHFRLIYSDYYSDNVRTIEELRDDSLITVKRIVTTEETANTPTFTTYQLIDDSLRVVQRETQVGIDYASVSQKRNGILTNDDHWQCYFLKKETYTYSADEHGRKYVEVTVEEARDGRWKTLKHKRISR